MPTPPPSTKPLPQKLQIKAGHRVALVALPGAVKERLMPLPADVRFDEAPDGSSDVVLVGAPSRAALEKHLPAVAPHVGPKTVLWVVYPKVSSKLKADVHRDSIDDYAKSLALVGVAICAIDDTWTALRLKKA